MDKPKVKMYFDEASHTYFNEDGVDYISNTTLIDKYKTPFDEKKWSAIKAVEKGISVQEMKDEWKAITKVACDNGNLVHKKLEFAIKGRNSKEFSSYEEVVDYNVLGAKSINPTIKIEYPTIYRDLQEQIDDGWSVYSEKRLFLHEYLVAGTCDVPLIKGRKLKIYDWKTNKDDLRFEAGYYKKRNGIRTGEWIRTNAKLLYPLTHIPECKGEMYTMQLSLYAYMFEHEFDLECVELRLYHIRGTDVQPIGIRYRRDDVMRMLKHYRGIDIHSGVDKSKLIGLR